MRIGSACSGGTDGLALGLEWAGLGHTIWQIEQSAFRRRCLAKTWPHAARHVDVRKVGKKELSYVDLFCFGFPCQDLSSAGSQAGLTGARSGLFYECARIAAELRPEWIVCENVASGAKLWVDPVMRELERLGYTCLPIPIAARDVGALHQRARIFVVAHLDQSRERPESGFFEVATPQALARAGYAPDASQVGQQAWHAERVTDAPGWPEPDGGGGQGSLTHVDGLDLRQLEQRHPRWRDTLQPPRETEFGFPGWGTPEPPVVRVVHGLSDRTYDAERRESLGDAVVPQCSEVVGHVIRVLIEKRLALDAVAPGE